MEPCFINDEKLSLLQRVEKEQKVIAEYRDKMYIERSNILNNYAKLTLRDGPMYYIYSKSLKKENTYLLCECEEGKTHSVIEANINDLPKNVTVDTVLRIKEGQYTIDEEATNKVLIEIKDMIIKLLEEQKKYLSEQRIEDNIYEVGEIEKDRVWLYNLTKNDGNGIEEINFPEDLLNKIMEGNKVKYKNSTYIII